MKEGLSEVAQTLKRDNDIIDKDMPSKRVLSYKGVLSRILKSFIPEFKQFSIKEIVRCLKNPIEITTTDDTLIDEEDIRFITVNNEVGNEGTNKKIFDLRFYVSTPNDNSPICVMINLEIQNNVDLPYPLENRDVYYKCESIVDQHGKIWFNDEYQNMVKVYTVWICTHPHKGDENSIREISLTQRKLYGNPALNSRGDLMTSYYLNLGDIASKEDDEYEALGMLDVIFAKMEFENKKQILENNFKLHMTKKEERNMNDMTLTNNGYFKAGEAKGLTKGEVIGEAKGATKEQFNGINILINALRKGKNDQEFIKEQLKEQYHLSDSLSDRFLNGNISLEEFLSGREKNN